MESKSKTPKSIILPIVFFLISTGVKFPLSISEVFRRCEATLSVRDFA
jgi:hypothetical protein